MRGSLLLLVFAAALCLPESAAKPLAEPFQSYFTATGRFMGGLPAGEVGEVPPASDPMNFRSVSFTVDDCYRDLQFRLEYEPANLTVGADPASLRIRYQFELRLVEAATGEALPNGSFFWEQPDTFEYAVPGPGPLRADLILRRGHDVSYNLTGGGWKSFDAECYQQGLLFLNELEQNPTGTDAGHEWVEVYNAGFQEVDLAGWQIQAHHGVPQTLTLPNGTLVAALGRLLVEFSAQFLDNEDEEVSLYGPHGWEVDRSPVLSDTANDARSWQRVPDASDAWDFGPSTAGLPNA